MWRPKVNGSPTRTWERGAGRKSAVRLRGRLLEVVARAAALNVVSSSVTTLIRGVVKKEKGRKRRQITPLLRGRGKMTKLEMWRPQDKK